MFGKTFSSNSFIYKFLAWPDAYISNAPRTICELRQSVILKCILILLGSIAWGSYVSSMVVFGLHALTHYFHGFAYGIFAGVTVWTRLGTVATFATSLALAFGLIIGAIGVTFDKIFNWKRKRDEEARAAGIPVKENPVVLMFTSWKDKICYPVTFKSDFTEVPEDNGLSWSDI